MRGQPPGHHHEPAPTTTAASNCLQGGWGVLMDGMRDRANDRNDDMDTKRMVGSGSNRGSQDCRVMNERRERQQQGGGAAMSLTKQAQTTSMVG